MAGRWLRFVAVTLTACGSATGSVSPAEPARVAHEPAQAANWYCGEVKVGPGGFAYGRSAVGLCYATAQACTADTHDQRCAPADEASCVVGQLLDDKRPIRAVCLDDTEDCHAVQVAFDRPVTSMTLVPCTPTRTHADLDVLVARAQGIADERSRQAERYVASRPEAPTPPTPSAQPAFTRSPSPMQPQATAGWWCFRSRDDDSACFPGDERARCERFRAEDVLAIGHECFEQPRAACLGMEWKLKDPTSRCFAEIGHCKRTRASYRSTKRDDLVSITECETRTSPQ